MGGAGSLEPGYHLPRFSPRFWSFFQDDFGQAMYSLLATLSLCIKKEKRKEKKKGAFQGSLQISRNFFNVDWPSQTSQSMRWRVSHQIALVAIIWIGALETLSTSLSCQRRWKCHFWPPHWPSPWTLQCLSYYHFQLVLCPLVRPDFSERV